MRNDKRVPGTLLGKRHVRLEYIDGVDWMLHQNPEDPLRFVAAVGNRILTPPDKYIFDGATVPRVCWRLIGPPTGHGPGANYMLHACMHDAGYEFQKWDDGTPLSRDEVDAIFWECMMDDDVDEWRCELMYKAVSFFGRWTFKGHKNWNEHNTRPQSDYTPPERGNT